MKWKKGLCMVLTLIMALASVCVPVIDLGFGISNVNAADTTKYGFVEFSTENYDLNQVLNDTVKYVLSVSANPGTGHQWYMLSLARLGYDDDELYETFYENCKAELVEKEGVLSTTRYTEYSKMILSMTAIGMDARDISGYDLLSNITDFNSVIKQGINGDIWALIALNCKDDYDLSEYENNLKNDESQDSENEINSTEKMIDYLLGKQNEDGGWSISGTISDVDMTSMAITALASYYDIDDSVKTVIDEALEFLSNAQLDNGGFKSYGTENVESTAQVLLALSTLGIDATTEERFIKNGINIVDIICGYQLSNGGFSHVAKGTVNATATAQSFYALTAFVRLVKNESALFDMNGDTIKAEEIIEVEDTGKETSKNTETTTNSTKDTDKSTETTTNSTKDTDKNTETTTDSTKDTDKNTETATKSTKKTKKVTKKTSDKSRKNKLSKDKITKNKLLNRKITKSILAKGKYKNSKSANSKTSTNTKTIRSKKNSHSKSSTTNNKKVSASKKKQWVKDKKDNEEASGWNFEGETYIPESDNAVGNSSEQDVATDTQKTGIASSIFNTIKENKVVVAVVIVAFALIIAAILFFTKSSTLMLLLLLLVPAFLSGCSKNNINLEDTNALEADGIVTKEEIKSFAGSDRSISFYSTDDNTGIKYTWTLDGSKIKNPMAQNLKLTFVTEESSEGELSLNQVKTLGNEAPFALIMETYGDELVCSPNLALEIPENLEIDTAYLCKYVDNALAIMSEIQITKDTKDTNNTKEDGKAITVLSMQVTELGDTYYIIGGSSQNEGYKITGENADSEDTDDETATSSKEKTTNSSNGNLEDEKNNISGSSQNEENEVTEENSDLEDKGEKSAGTSKEKTTNNSNSNLKDEKNNASGNSKNNSKSATKKSSENSTDTTTKNTTTGKTDTGSNNTCTISISCNTILDNINLLNEAKKDFVPEDGWILKETTVTIKEGDTVFDILKRVCKKKGIHMEYEYSIGYSSAYIEGINQLYDFDCGELSGWMYSVNGWFPNYGCGQYDVEPGDKIEFQYTCDMGTDLK